MPAHALRLIPTCAETDSGFGDSQGRESLNQWPRAMEGVVMGKGMALRVDFDGAQLRLLARRTKNANQGRRLLALAEIYDGSSRSRSAVSGGRLCATGSSGSTRAVLRD